jgi:hypothetical protein
MTQHTHPSALARQPYTGELVNKDPISSVLARTGQINPIVRDRFMQMHGRHYSGFGTDVSLNDPFPGNANAGDIEYADNEAMDAMETEDDVAGSGIFDAPGRRSTIHSTLGVFADHPSLPGYAAREQPFAVSKDVTDPIHGADVVYLPAGGMTYVEREGRYADYLDREQSVPPPAVLFPTDLPPGTVPEPGSSELPLAPVDLPPAPDAAPPAAAGYGAYSQMFQPTRPANRLPVRSIVTPLQLRQSVGADAPASPSWGTYLMAGGIVGVAAAILVGTLNIKPGSGRKKGRRR